MVALLESEFRAWFDPIMAVTATYPIICALIGLTWIACLLTRSVFAAIVASVLATAAFVLLAPQLTDTLRWIVVALVLLANALLALHIRIWRRAAARELARVNSELERVTRAYDKEVQWRMAAYRQEASQIEKADLPIAELTQRVEKLARQLDSRKNGASPEGKAPSGLVLAPDLVPGDKPAPALRTVPGAGDGATPLRFPRKPRATVRLAPQR